MAQITNLLKRAGDGDRTALDELMPLVYEHLRRMAHGQLGPGGVRTALDTTALVHEAYLALADHGDADWHDRAHFYRYVATAMRNLLINRARARLRDKRGGGAVHVELEAIEVSGPDSAADLLAIDGALQEIALQEPRLIEVIELRFFAGLSVADTARSLELTERTVVRDWQKARALLARMLAP